MYRSADGTTTHSAVPPAATKNRTRTGGDFAWVLMGTTPRSLRQTFGWRRSTIVPWVGWLSAVLALISLYLAFQLRPKNKQDPEEEAYFLLAFWAVVPPTWFLVEYVFWPPLDGRDDERTKHLHDLSRNIWLALIVVLAAIMRVQWPWQS